MKPLSFPLGLSYDDVLLVPQPSSIVSRSSIDLSVRLTPHVRLEVPIVSSNMDTVTGIDMAIALGKLGGLGVLPRFNAPQQQADLITQIKQAGVLAAAAVGIKDGFLDRVSLLVAAGVDLLVIDVAHGHMAQAIAAARQIKRAFPKVDLAAGNVATYQGALDLFSAGADCVKVGIGPGAACTTRIATGFGVPQITAVVDAAAAAHKFRRTIICDGGIKNSGDIVKGLAAGAHVVMLGSLLAGTDVSPGHLILENGRKYKKYNGSTSTEEKRRQIQSQPRSNPNQECLAHIEGVSALVPYQGSLDSVVTGLAAGIRSGLSYAGAQSIKELHRRAQFIRITPQGARESGSHDVIPTESVQSPVHPESDLRL